MRAEKGNLEGIELSLITEGKPKLQRSAFLFLAFLFSLVASAALAQGVLTYPVGSSGAQAAAISGISSGSPGSTSATITFSTALGASSCTVNYGATTGYGSTASDSAPGSSPHSVGLLSLTASTSYHYDVACTYSGYSVTSADNTFTTAAPAYTGPLDVLGGTTNVLLWGSTRCPSASFVGNLFKVTDNTTTHTDTVSCSGGSLSSTPDSVATLLTDCVGGNCGAVEFWDVSGHTNCVGPVACNFNATGTPAFYSGAGCSSLGGTTQFCVLLTSSTWFQPSSNLASAVSIPYTIWMIANRTNSNGGLSDAVLFNNSTVDEYLGFFSDTQVRAHEGSGLTVYGSANTGTWYTFLGSYNTTNHFVVNSTDNTGTGNLETYAAGTLIIPVNLDSGERVLITEWGFLSSDAHTNAAALSANARAYWGF